jgi:hypothetical protein
MSWVNSNGMDCILIGPQTQCFCQHRYIQHQTDFKKLPSPGQPIIQPCNERGCKCSTFTYVPRNGMQAIRCTGCKHTTDEHKPSKPFNCTKSISTFCSIFKIFDVYILFYPKVDVIVMNFEAPILVVNIQLYY